MMNNQEYVCCICGKKFTGWGNDPWPVDMRDNVECCDVCNSIYVIPARLAGLRKENTDAE